MHTIHPVALMLLGLLLMIGSFLAIFAMVLRLIDPGFLLSFLAYALSFLGLLLGLVGILNYRSNPHDK